MTPDDKAALAFHERARAVANALGLRLCGSDHHSGTCSVGGVERSVIDIPRVVFEYIERKEAAARAAGGGKHE